MSISVKNISISIGDKTSSRFDINFEGTKYRLDNFSLHQSLLNYNTLCFSMHKGPEEDRKEAKFTVCGQIIGQKVVVKLQTDNIENLSLSTQNENVADIEFNGFIFSASGTRSESEYYINVEARSWDALLEDNPNCKSFENQTLENIVNDIVKEYQKNSDSDDKKFLETKIKPRFKDTIPYCVQYNETNYQFLQRLACRYGEWLYNDGTKLVFGNVVEQDNVRLFYPSKDIPSYNVDLKMQHVAFAHVASSYNAYDATQKDGIGEMQKEYNSLSEQVFQASQACYTKPTLQNLHSGGYANNDGRETILDVSTKTQARGEKAGMLTYSGTTYCSKLKIGSTLGITDNVITNSFLNTKSMVDQDEILITELIHYFSADETYSNHFTGVSVECDYPPYYNSDVYPVATSCRAKVMDNKDPKNLGRIRVQFDWQALQGKGMMTPWLRMAQPYAGGGKGFSFIPEKGEEVMVDFEGGNAERPYVKGTLYNGKNSVDKSWVSDSNTKNQVKAIRTRNGHTIEIHDEEEGGFIRIYDNKKENYVLTFSTDDKLIKLESKGNIELEAENDIIMKAGHDMQITVGNNRTLTVKGNDTIDIKKDQGIDVGNDRETKIKHNDNLTIEGDQTIDIKGNKDERIDGKGYISAKDYMEDIDNELIVSAKKQQNVSSEFTKIDGGNQIDIIANITKIN